MPGFAHVLLALRTVRHLDGVQILHRLRHRLVGRPSPRNFAATWNESRAQSIARALTALGPVGAPSDARNAVTAWINGRVNVLGLSEPVPVTWREPAPSALFRYHLHYHDTLADAAWVASTADDPAARAVVKTGIHDWLSSWETGGAPAWDPYPIAVRAVNWVRMFGWGEWDPDDAALRQSLARQVDVLSRDLEWDARANHLLRNAWALAIAPGCFEDEWANRMWHNGRELFWRCLLDQVDEDGVHEERAPMYQARILRDALEVVAVCDALLAPVPREARTRVAKLAQALRWMCRADGSLRLINDSASDHGVDIDGLLQIAEAAEANSEYRERSVWAPAHARFAAACDESRSNMLFVDLGGPSPAHQPAHSHAGALAFECELAGRRVVVDGGCSGYEGDPWREYFRGTAAHSTVVIDGKNQSEMWATFRVARRAHVDPPIVSEHAPRVEIRGRCRPYHLPTASHERVLRWSPSQITIADRVPGAEGHGVESFFHFDPAWSASKSADNVIELTQPSRRVVIRVAGAPNVTLHRGDEAPRCGWRAAGFNRVVPSYSVRLSSGSYAGEEWRTTINTE